MSDHLFNYSFRIRGSEQLLRSGASPDGPSIDSIDLKEVYKSMKESGYPLNPELQEKEWNSLKLAGDCSEISIKAGSECYRYRKGVYGSGGKGFGFVKVDANFTVPQNEYEPFQKALIEAISTNTSRGSRMPFLPKKLLKQIIDKEKSEKI